MVESWLLPEKLFDGQTLHNSAAACVRDGIVDHIANSADIPPNADIQRLNGTLMPGFFDIQINGGGGVLFNAEPNREGLKKIGAAHRRFGTCFWLPTVITDTPEIMAEAVTAVIECIGDYGIVGIHIEGPHLSLPRRGTHNPAYIRPFDNQSLAQLKRLRAANIPVLLTLAPEAVQTGQVAELVALGVIVSIGHSDANAADAKAVLNEGAQLFTHLFNAMSQMKGREPGVVGAAINSHAYTSIIADGLHVEPSMLALATRARPIADRMILVTDAMATVGGANSFELYGQTVHLDAGRLVNAEGALAGAHITIPEEIKIMVESGISLEMVLRMATSNPAKLMRLERHIGQLIGSALADLVLLSKNGFAKPLPAAS